jgi:DNA-binding MarR family transcriptional regulator
MKAKASPAGRQTTANQPAAARFVDDYLAALLAQASHLISDEFHRVVRAQDLSVSEWRVLASLAGAEPISTGRLAQLAVLKQPTVTRMLDRLEAEGRVERLAQAGDRRVTLVRITAAGARTVARLIALAREHETRVLEPFGLPRAEALKATLRGIIASRRGAPALE